MNILRQSMQFAMRKAFLVVSILISTFFSLKAQFSFNLAQLQGTSSQVPTTLDFGPDGKLYVGEQYGTIKIYTISKNGNSYSVTNTQTVTLILDMQNHNDNGANFNYNGSGYKARQITGLMVLGTAANPVMYVASSDARIGGGGNANDEQQDTNSGTISKLTWTGSAWDKVDLVRGLPRSEEAHAPNGMHLDPSTNTLYVSVGGITNAGSPSNNFVFTCEYALSSAILKIDMNVINSLPVRGSGNSKYIYDLPTLDDPTRTNISNPDYNASLPGSQQTIDQGDPWGGNDGRNMAKLVPGGPVQIHSPGYRNAYDIVVTQTPGKEGRMYTIDNGPNQGWGGYPKNVNTLNITNEYQSSEPGSTNPTGSLPTVNNLDNLHLVSKPGMTPIYGGHPNPLRANPAGAGLYYKTGGSRVFSSSPTSDWPPVPLNMADTREANYLVAGQNDGSLTTFIYSTNGMAEYVSPNYFNGGITGDIFTVDLNGTVWRLKFNAAGTAVTTKESFASGFATNLLDITIQGAGEAFDGSIWVTDYGGNKIFVFTPASGATGNCTGNNTSWTLDDDGDGFKNADEADNGTNPCSAISFPPDLDGDKLSDKNDPDDDNDGINDINDAFYRDATNGMNTPNTIQYPFLNGNPGTGLFGLGFTGLMINNSANPAQLFNPEDPGLIMGGAVGLASFPADAGKASSNNQMNGFQFGYTIPASPIPFSVQSSLIGPFFNSQNASSLNSNHRQGIYIGNGDQDNFLAIALSGATGGGTPGLRLFGESGGNETINLFTPVSNILSATNIYLYLDVNPSSSLVTASYSTNVNTNKVILGSFTVTGNLASKLNGNAAIAVGLIGYSGTSSTYQAQYDFLDILPINGPTVVTPVPNQEITLGTASKDINIANTFADPGGVENLTFSISGNTNTSLVTGASFNGTTLTLNFSNSTGTSLVKIKATNGSGQTAEDEFLVTVSDPSNPAPQVANAISDQNVNANTPNVVVSFANTFSDDGGPGNLSYSVTANSNSALITGTTINGTDLTLNIASGMTGASTIRLRATDAQGQFVEDEFIVSVSQSNSAPVVSNPITDKSVTVNTASLVVSFSNTFTDNGGAGNLNFGVTGNTNTSLITNTSISSTNLTLTIAAGQTGSSTIRLRATDAGGLFVEDEFVVTVTGGTGTAVKLINAGGSSVTFNGQTWGADNSFSGGSTYSVGNAIAGTTNDAIYQTERFGNFNYSIPLTNGSYTVILHFAETYFTSNNARVFNVSIEGQTVLSNYDIHAKAGANTATTEQFNVNLTDGTININFTTVTNNAKVSAIEILSNTGGPANTAPVIANAITDKSVTVNTPSLVVGFANTFSDDGGTASLVYSVTGNTNTSLITNASINGTNLTLTIAGGQTGMSAIKLRATDAQGLFVEDEFNVAVNSAANAAPTVANAITDKSVAINSGSLVVAFANTFSDDGGTGSLTYSVTGNTNTSLITNTSINGTNLTLTIASGQTGSSTIKLRATDAGSLFVEDEFIVTMTGGGPGTVVKLINAGGPAVTFNSQTWGADNSFSGGSTYSVGNAIAGTTNDAIYQTERFGNFNYSIPLTNGSYTVILHFAETYFTTNNSRKFNVTIEGQTVLSSYDIHAKVGANTATTEQFNVNLTDGTININFTTVTNNAKVSAIEILSNSGGPTNTAPVVANAITDKSVTVNTPSLVVAFSNTFNDDGGANNLTYSITGNTNTTLITGTSINGTNLTLNIASGQTGMSAIKLRATDAQGLFVEDEFNVAVNSAANSAPIIANAITDKSVTVNTASLVVAVANTFNDDGGAANLVLSISGNTNTALVTGTSFNGTNLTLTFAANITGSANIKVKATDAQGLFAEDEFVVTVTSAPVANSILINSGGPAVTLSGRSWAADKNFSGGTSYSYGSVAINGTVDDALYQTERFGNFNYAVPVTNGSYTVKLHFAETYFTTSNSRKFNVNIENGKGTLSNYDIYAQAGANTAKVETFSNISVTDGTLNIAFTTVTNNAKVCAIEIIPNSSTRIAAPDASFDAILTADEVKLSWKNLPEDQTGAVTIERSPDGIQFEELETIEPSARKTQHSGEYVDIRPFKGISYYRLKTHSTDGIIRYSVVRSVVFNLESSAFLIYPNPNTTTGLVFMEFPLKSPNETISIRILTVQGAEIYRGLKIERGTRTIMSFRLPPSLRPGTYIVEIDQNGTKRHARLVVN